MSYTLKDIKGLGKKTAKNLEEAGITSVETLANSKIEDLIDIEGIGKASAEKFIKRAIELLGESKEVSEEKEEKISEEKEEEIVEKKAKQEIQKQEEKIKHLEGTKVEQGDFILLKITGKTRRGKVFRVSSEEDAKTAGIYDEEKAKQGHYTPEFVVVGKPGFLNEGLMQTVEEMSYFEKKSVRIPPEKAFGKRDPAKIERVGLARFRRMNKGKAPEIGGEFVKQTQQGAQRGTITNIVQGKVIIDYNHPLAGQKLDYNIEIMDKIEDFDEKIKYFLINKGIPPENTKDFDIKYLEDDKSLEITIPKMYLFQNLTYLKFGLAMDLQNYLNDKIDDVKFIEVYEKMPSPEATEESVMQKVKEYDEKQKKEEIEEEEIIEETLDKQ